MRSRVGACATLALALPCACSSTPAGPKETAAPELVVVSAPAAPDAARSAWLASERAAGRPVFPQAEVAPCLASNRARPDHLIAAWMSDGVGAVVQCATSSDGGRKWSAPAALPLTACVPGGPADEARASAPSVAFGPDGKAYLAALGGRTPALYALVSDDGGLRWSAPQVLPGTGGPTCNGAPTTIADPTRPGCAWIVWTQYTAERAAAAGEAHDAIPFRGRGVLAQTLDGGRTWSEPRVVVDVPTGGTIEGLALLADPRNGALHLLWTHGALGRTLAHRTSRDQGASWSAPNEVASYVPLKRTVTSPIDGRTRIATAPGLLQAALDPANGRMFVVFVDGRYSAGEVEQVSLTSSIDGGSTWAAPVRISQGSGIAWQPAIAIDAAGRVGVSYCDARGATDAEEHSLPVSLWLDTLTFKEGRVDETDERRLDRFNLLAAPMLGERGLWTGDRGALVAVGGRFRVLYARPMLGPDEPFVPGGDAERNPTDVCVR